jgi:DNA-binding CsgD family transcriptional regulator
MQTRERRTVGKGTERQQGSIVASAIRDNAATIALLGIYWAWTALAFLNFVGSIGQGSAQVNDWARMAGLFACGIVTLSIAAIPRVDEVVARRGPKAAIGLAAAGASFVTTTGAFGNSAACSVAGIVMGVAAALLLYILCKRIAPSVGMETVGVVFASMLSVGSLSYLAICQIGGIAAVIITTCLPVIIYVADTKGAPGDAPSDHDDGESARTETFTNGRSSVQDERRPVVDEGRPSFPLQVILGFSVFGFAFGISREVPLDDSVFRFSYHLVYQAMSAASGLILIGVVSRAKNLFFSISMLGAASFVCTFLATYLSVREVAVYIENITSALGYACFELMMWIVIYEIASETTTRFEVAFGLGRGIMQTAIVAGAAVSHLATSSLSSSAYAPILQISIMAMLVVLLGCFSTRDALELWGMRKAKLDLQEHEDTPKTEAEITSTLAEALGLSPRECEIALLLMRGRSEPYIAETLFVSRSTVHSHVTRMYAKTGVHSRQEFLNLIASALE